MNLRKAVLAVLAMALWATAMMGQTAAKESTAANESTPSSGVEGGATGNAYGARAWTLGAFASGGTGLNDRSDVQFANFGVRGGRVLLSRVGDHWFSGALEYNAEFIPYTHYFWKGQTGFNGFALNPFVWKWSFVRATSQKFVPFFLVHGGFVRTTKNMPPGDTADYNFTSGAGVGANYFVRPNKSISFDVRALHLSNASIGNHNPGVNASLQFTLGFNWFKR